MAFYCLTYIAVNMATRDAHGVDTLRDILTGLMSASIARSRSTVR